MSLGGDNHSTTISFRRAVVELSWDKVFTSPPPPPKTKKEITVALNVH